MRIEFISKINKPSTRMQEEIDKFENIVDKKLEKMSRYFDDSVKTKVMLKGMKDAFVLEITIFVDGSNIMRGEVKDKDMFSTIDLVIPKLERQIRKYKTRIGKKLKDDNFDDKFVAEDNGDKFVEKMAELARVKTVELKKITVQDAIGEMELLDHDFYVFINDENGLVNLIYKRQDGDVGLLDLVY